MYILEVIPLITLPPQAPQLLSYFFDHEIKPGTLVEGLVGKRTIKGVVLSCSPLEQNKIAIKKAGFQLKNITRVISETPVVEPYQLKITAWLAHHYYAPLGACLKTVLPQFFGVKKYMPKAGERDSSTKSTEDNTRETKTTTLYSPAKDTIPNLLPRLKRALKDGEQVLIITPEIVIARHFAEKLSDSYPTLLLTSEATNAEYFSIWQEVASGSTKIIVATRAGLFLPFKNLGLIVVEDESNEAYKSDMTPRYNTPDVAHTIAYLHKAELLLTSPIPDLTVFNAVKKGEVAVIDKTGRPDTSIIITDAVAEMKSGNFSMFSRKFQDLLTDAIVSGKKVLLFSVRKAYAGILLCRNCGAIKKCPKCDIPMRAYKTPSNLPGGTERMLICYHCSTYLSAPNACPNCKSNQLATAGTAGSQKIEETLNSFISRSNVIPEEIKKSVKTFILDSDLTRTQAHEDELTEKIEREKSPIVIATQKIFSHRYRWNFDLIGIPNADGLTSSRDFRTEERFLINFEKFFDFKPENILIQTYNPDGGILNSVRTGEYETFYESELTARKAMGYPPFTRIAKLTYRHRHPERASLSARTLGEKLKMVLHQLELKSQVSILGPSPASISKENNFYSYNIILKLSPTLKRPETILKYVPSDWMVDMDPKNLI